MKIERIVKEVGAIAAVVIIAIKRFQEQWQLKKSDCRQINSLTDNNQSQLILKIIIKINLKHI